MNNINEIDLDNTIGRGEEESERNSEHNYMHKGHKEALRQLKKAVAELYLSIKQKTRDEVSILER